MYIYVCMYVYIYIYIYIYIDIAHPPQPTRAAGGRGLRLEAREVGRGGIDLR